ncbi:3183_t:CDS:2 [Ambispora gerdemannii]|uniref:3183_t:CDS:1 n=1 Tax=Ambispora gerdemannii TaxID=144530 RepID=A0A9N9G066_9GLOM|nr:3183_t:CDS:2 [Ambispora gerdemannii]
MLERSCLFLCAVDDEVEEIVDEGENFIVAAADYSLGHYHGFDWPINSVT